MTFREHTFTRRQLLAGGATLATGLAAGTWQIRSKRNHGPVTDLAPPPNPKPLTKSPKAIVDEPVDTRPYHLRKTETYEEDYANYIHALGLTYIAPFELLHVHRNSCRGVHNCLPPEKIWDEMAPTLLVADELRARLGKRMLVITSAYRSPRYNRVIPGSASRSYHTKNCALDLVYDCPPQVVFEEAKEMRREGIFRGGIGLYSSFVHLDTRGTNAIWSRV